MIAASSFRRSLHFAALLAIGAASSRASEPEPARLLERIAPSIVNVKIVLKTEFNMGESTQDQESTLEARGALVGENGLVMLWNSQLSASRLVEALEQMGDGGQFRLKMTPTDFRISLPGDPTEYVAFLAAADSDLDLAFLQLEAPPQRKLPAIDFARAREPAVGDTVVAVSRLSPGFDRAAYFESSVIAGRLDKPRRAWIVELSSDFLGLPAFDARGDVVGVVITIFNRSGDGSAQGSDLLGVLALGKGGRETGPLGVFLLPGGRVRELVAEASKRALELLGERSSSSGAAKPGS